MARVPAPELLHLQPVGHRVAVLGDLVGELDVEMRLKRFQIKAIFLVDTGLTVRIFGQFFGLFVLVII